MRNVSVAPLLDIKNISTQKCFSFYGEAYRQLDQTPLEPSVVLVCNQTAKASPCELIATFGSVESPL
jgi:hypothetical protein